jgi:hypothetical protein
MSDDVTQNLDLRAVRLDLFLCPVSAVHTQISFIADTPAHVPVHVFMRAQRFSNTGASRRGHRLVEFH